MQSAPMYWSTISGPKDAQALIDSVLRDDPKNALAHETMGYLKFREGDIQAARKWYGEAVKLDSQSYLANYYYAAMSLGPGGPGQDPDIESSLRTCIKLNPAFAPAYDALARYYMRRSCENQRSPHVEHSGNHPRARQYRLPLERRHGSRERLTDITTLWPC